MMDMDRIVDIQTAKSLPYDEETEALAYQLWAFKCGRRVKDVVRQLSTEERGRVPDEHTIRRWAREQGWAEKVRQDIRSIAPDLTEQTIVELILGRAESVTYLRKVVQEASEPTPVLDQRGRALGMDGEWHDVRVAFQPNKDAITAAVALMDRGGLSHVGSKADPTSGMANASVVQDDEVLDGLSVSELMAIEARSRGKKKG